jgi:hypothetical protein
MSDARNPHNGIMGRTCDCPTCPNAITINISARYRRHSNVLLHFSICRPDRCSNKSGGSENSPGGFCRAGTGDRFRDESEWFSVASGVHRARDNGALFRRATSVVACLQISETLASFR